jgi:hypothetical protein
MATILTSDTSSAVKTDSERAALLKSMIAYSGNRGAGSGRRLSRRACSHRRPAEAWREGFAVVGEITVAVTAWARMTLAASPLQSAGSA